MNFRQVPLFFVRARPIRLIGSGNLTGQRAVFLFHQPKMRENQTATQNITDILSHRRTLARHI